MNDSIDLDSFLFKDEDDIEIPVGYRSNVDGNIAHLRDEYLKAEKEYFKELVKDEVVKEILETLVTYDTDSLIDYARSLKNNMESGEVETPEELARMSAMSSFQRDEYHMGKLEKTEGILCLVLAAIQDKTLLKELTLTRTR